MLRSRLFIKAKDAMCRNVVRSHQSLAVSARETVIYALLEGKTETEVGDGGEGRRRGGGGGRVYNWYIWYSKFISYVFLTAISIRDGGLDGDTSPEFLDWFVLDCRVTRDSRLAA